MSADRRLFLALDRAAHQVRERLEVVCRERLEVSSTQLGALLFLVRRDGARVGEVAEGLRVGPAAITGLAERMGAAGLVKKQACPEDARVQRLWLTAKGRRAADGGRGLVASANAALAKRFTEAELAVVARFLAEIGELELVPREEQS